MIPARSFCALWGAALVVVVVIHHGFIATNVVSGFQNHHGSTFISSSSSIYGQSRKQQRVGVQRSSPTLLMSFDHHHQQLQPQQHQKLTKLEASSVIQTSSDSNDTTYAFGTIRRFVSKSLVDVRHFITGITTSMDEIALWRCAAVLFIASLAVFHKPIDAKLASLWMYLTTSSGLWARWFRHDHWEWLLAVMAFNVWIHGFFLADRAVLKASRQGKDHPFRKHRLQDRLVAQQHYRDLLSQKQLQHESSSDGTKCNVVVDMDQPPPFVTKHSKWHWGGYIGELWVYMVPLFIWDKLDPRRHRLLARFAAPTTLQICRDITLSLLMYDMLFFFGHLLMHKVPIVNRLFGHKKHHTTPEVRSGDIVRLSVFEQVLEVGFSIVAIRTLKSHPVSRSIYNCIITFLLTELHCGFDFPWTPQNVIPFEFATGSRRHHYHHRYGRHYYQKFFCHVDRLFGFMQPDDGSIMGDSVKPLQKIANKMSWPEGAKKTATARASSCNTGNISAEL